jgi:hypothetical protein
MPIEKEKFEEGKIHSKLEEEVISFLNERRDRAFTSQEIMRGMQLHTNFSTPEIAMMSTFAIADFTALLYSLVSKGEIRMQMIKNRMYFMAGGAAKCPKCGMKVTEPKKTWKMAGRPDKKGRRLQLHIGLFECPKHGVFRAVLGKERI